MPETFVTWELIGSYAGAVAMVITLTEFVKNLGILKRVPTQLLTYILSLLILFPAMYFTNQLTWDTAAQTLFNGVLVSIAANGGFEGIGRLLGRHLDGEIYITHANLANNAEDANYLNLVLTSNLEQIQKKNSITLKVCDDTILMS